jgi:catechol 2,3-dioxygenase-like lactoylglutathione lyase family enzyme
MIDHLSTYTTDFEAARGFYDAALAALGYERNVEMVMEWDTEFPNRRACAYGAGPKPTFWLVEVRETFTPRHVAFAARDRAAVDAFHAAGLGAGGTDNGAPGERPIYHPGYYGSFVLDPDGNNVEAVNHG